MVEFFDPGLIAKFGRKLGWSAPIDVLKTVKPDETVIAVSGSVAHTDLDEAFETFRKGTGLEPKFYAVPTARLKRCANVNGYTRKS